MEKMSWTVYDPALGLQFIELDYVQICLLMYKNPKSGDTEQGTFLTGMS